MRIQSVLGCLIGGLLLPPCVCAQGFRANSTVPSVHVSGPDAQSFRQETTAFLANAATRELVEPLVPYSIRITNRDPRRISYYVVRYNFGDANQKPVRTVFRVGIRGVAGLETGKSEYLFPLPDVRGRIEKGVAIPSAGLAALSRTRATLLEQFGRTPVVEASLDAVVFEDGELAGADTVTTFHYLNAFSSGIHSFARGVTALMEGPTPPLADYLEKISRQTAFEAKTGSGEAHSELDETSFADRLAKANLRIAQAALAGSLLRTLQRGDISLMRAQIEDYRNSDLYSPVWRRP